MIKSVISIFLACILFFIFLYIIVDIFNHLDEIIKEKTKLSTLIDYYLTYIPIIFVQITPLAYLVAVIFSLGNLNRHNEIIAMRSAGLSILQISRTLIFLSILLSLTVFLVNEKFVPSSTQILETLKTDIRKDTKGKELKEFINFCMYGSKNRLFFINKLSLRENTMQGITILQHDENQNIIKKIVAKKGVWEDGIWSFYGVFTYNFDEDGQIKGELNYNQEEIMDISESPQDFIRQRQNPQSMNIKQLQSYILKLSKSSVKAVARNLKVDLYNRYLSPFNTLVITILGISFALRIRSRLTALSSLGISLGMGFLYYVINAISLAMGKVGILTSWLSASLAHILFLSIGIYLLIHL
ncbi:MAG: LptF/LptG family permease [Candidatus Omnitrophica bacterium]|nr:LptF/LptG family permease [Candidatus Omnitrophota bacterium]